MTQNDPFPGSPGDPAARTIEHDPALARPVSERPVKPRRGGAGGTIFTLFLFLLLAGGLYYVWTNPKGPDDSNALGTVQRQVQTQGQTVGQQTSQLQGLTQQLQTLTDRVDKLEKAVAAAQVVAAAAPQAPSQASPAAPPDLGDLPQRVDALSAKVEALANQPAPAPAPAPAPVAVAPADNGAEEQALAALSQRVQQIEAADRTALGQLQAQQKEALDQTQAQQKAALDQAQAQQKAAIDQSQAAVLAEQKSAIRQIDGRLSKLEQGAGTVEDAASRATRLERVQAAVVALQAGQKLGDIPGAPPALARFADKAPPTEAALRESFPALAAHVRDVSQPNTAHKTFLQRTLARLQESVTVRQGDDVLVGDPAAGVLSDAELRVQNGDLAGAVQRLDALNGPAATAMAGWVDQARALVAARAALANLAARG